ncbi:GGDEF domain-containing protein [Acinetobacter sp. KS-LM10]|uniref:GGDEF domain-containing protein n=1 Tax=Acinetobacter sp. KS-LM10 TaxID=3120518 RepID=UPI0030D3A9E1
MLRLHTEQTGKRLFASMLIIVFSLLCITIPLLVSHYHHYQKANFALIEMKGLGAVADLANLISRERGPTNLAMSSSKNELQKNVAALKEHRKRVDQHIDITFKALNEAGFNALAQNFKGEIKAQLALARNDVDRYLETPCSQLDVKQFDLAIFKMFQAWDTSYDLLKNVVMQSLNKESALADYYTLVLILVEMRDQAGRVASNVMAHVTFGLPLPSENIARSQDAQRQVLYLWGLVNTIQPQQDKSEDFNYLNQKVKTEFIDTGIPIVMRLINESEQKKPYYLKGTELTTEISEKLTTVIKFQKYLLDRSILAATIEKNNSRKSLIVNSLIALISLFAALFTLIYAQRKVFAPLIQARDMIVELSYAHTNSGHGLVQQEHRRVSSLSDALDKLQLMLKQRDAFEFELKSIANTDQLTGVFNRLALDDYLKKTKNSELDFNDICLIIVDIDNFKHVNDQHGHIFGDEVIVSVAKCLKANVSDSDLIIRFGGDEFLVILHKTDLENSMQSAENIRQAVAELNINVPNSDQNITVSVSIGVAVGAESWIDLLNQADKSLFKAKARGKNAVER